MHSKYVNPPINQQLWEDGYYRTRFSTESIEWRDYHSKWHKAYWDLMYKKDSWCTHLRELNHQQAARIMELEHDLRQARRNHE